MSSGTLFLQSALIGLSVAAPLGPIGLLCMQRALESGARYGLVSGLGAASADALYALLGALGTNALMHAFTGIAGPLALAGALFMLWLGVGMLRAPTASDPAKTPRTTGLPAAYASVLALTATNPMTVTTFIAIFAALGSQQAVAGGTAVFVSGVFIGSALWWVVLSFGCAALRHRINLQIRSGINRAAGAVLVAFALYKLAQLAI
ncbi:LysE family translocator [Craterilacuibacter sinensis]|uniref:LysE family transporter n=1 Tax=Craterilacuibacter sinensis TaxID=2686017 RepID=A0A845BMT2_9NEIS|nr:LysE family transporter [Craterilacuibacter sinensis]MXR35761.1 LysE family transporter [Craterilacuibacter sinensis]